MPISSPNPMFDHLLESSQWDDSNKWLNIGFGEEICILEIKIHTLSGPWLDNNYNTEIGSSDSIAILVLHQEEVKMS